MDTLRIATRKSPLALWQAEHVAARLGETHQGLRVELVSMSTQGDKLLDAPLAKVGGKGLFVKELEQALFDGRADIAVHSMKDVPVSLPKGLHIPVIMERGDVRDALVTREHCRGLSELPSGCRVGTSSLRRRSQLLSIRPDLRVETVRGGVHTRLAKLDAGEYDALILAAVGLERMQMGNRIAQVIPTTDMLPAVGQGALGIECRVDEQLVENLIRPLRHPESARLLAAERAMNRALEGGCQVPIAGYAERVGDEVFLSGLVASLDGRTVIRERLGSRSLAPEVLGSQVAESLLRRGADVILQQVYAQGGV